MRQHFSLAAGRHGWTSAFCSALLLCGLVVLAPAADTPSPLEKQADAVLKKIVARMKGSSVEAPKLRRELLALRLAYPGTKAGIEAAFALGKLPSSLDRLDAKTIAPLEKFSWQPKELVGILGEHRGRHGATVTSVTFSADNKFVVSGGGIYLRVWDAATMRLIDLGSLAYISSVAITKNKKFIVAGSVYGAIGVWEFVDGKKLQYKFSIAASTSHIYAVACHPDSKRIAAACFDNVVRVYDISGPAVKDLGIVNGHEKAVLCTAFSPDGKMLATGSDDLTARVWDMTTPEYKERTRLENHSGGVSSLAFNPSGKTLATGCSDGSIRFWGVPAGAHVKAAKATYQAGKTGVLSLSYSASAGSLAATLGDNTVRVLNVRGKPSERNRLTGPTDPVRSVAFSPDSKLLVSGGDDHVVRTWDMTKAKPVERFEPWSHLSHVYSVAFAPDDQTLASGSLDRVVRFWDLDRPAPRTRKFLKGDNIAVYAVAYSADGKLVAAAGNSVKIRQWDAKAGGTRASCSGHPGAVSGMTYSPDGRYLLTSSGKEALVFDAGRGTEVSRYSKHETNITCIAFSPDGRKALTGSGYYLYDKAGKIVLKDGKYVYTDCMLRLWDADKAEDLGMVKPAETPFYCAAMSVDSRHVWAGNYTPLLRQFRLKDSTFTEEPGIKGGVGYPHYVLPTADGLRLLIRGLDSKLILWDLVANKRLYEWTFNEQLGGVAITTDGRHLAVGLGTGAIYVLRLETGGKGDGEKGSNRPRP